MCCRFYSDETTQKDIVGLVDGYDKGIDWLREGDVHPGDKATVIIKGSNGLFAGDMRFGMLSQAVKKASGAGAAGAALSVPEKAPALLINARAETVREKKSFAESVAERRCVIPAKKFYEWDRDKNKAEFSPVKEKSVYLAGIYRYDNAAEAAELSALPGIQNGRFVILTTAANSSMKPVHDRMPLTLRRDQIEPWLTDSEKTDEILSQTPEELSVYREFEQLSLF
ncbi:MAG: SOS response-associated peptidase [Lachnospiraceae bacterium]|nr:SOS response-associated peptidase [Lachnospiraceae bacterium]